MKLDMCKSLFEDDFFMAKNNNNPKSEQKNQLVLIFFAGSGLVAEGDGRTFKETAAYSR